MKFKSVPLSSFFVLITVLLLIAGCGGSSDQTTATASDAIKAPPSVTYTSDPCSAGGIRNYTPLDFIVTDSIGNPKQGVEVTFYTGTSGSLSDPFWYTDDSNFVVRTDGIGVFQMIKVSTDSSGKATVYWSTSILPDANPPSGTDAGEDIHGVDFVDARAGIHSATFTVTWTMKGCPAP